MKVLVRTFNQEKALVGAFSVIVKTDCETDGALHSTRYKQSEDPETPPLHDTAGVLRSLLRAAPGPGPSLSGPRRLGYQGRAQWQLFSGHLNNIQTN